MFFRSSLVLRYVQKLGNRISNEKGLSVMALSDDSEGGSKVVVVENQNGRKCLNCRWTAQRVELCTCDGPPPAFLADIQKTFRRARKELGRCRRADVRDVDLTQATAHFPNPRVSRKFEIQTWSAPGRLSLVCRL